MGDRAGTTSRASRRSQYVRTRHGLPSGDFDRINRQQNFLRALMGKILADGTIGNPVKLNRHPRRDHREPHRRRELDERATSVAWRCGCAASTVQKVRFMTLPLVRYQDIPDVGSSVNIIDRQARQAALEGACATDKVGPYLKDNPDDELPDPKDVS